MPHTCSIQKALLYFSYSTLTSGVFKVNTRRTHYLISQHYHVLPLHQYTSMIMVIIAYRILQAFIQVTAARKQAKAIHVNAAIAQYKLFVYLFECHKSLAIPQKCIAHSTLPNPLPAPPLLQMCHAAFVAASCLLPKNQPLQKMTFVFSHALPGFAGDGVKRITMPDNKNKKDFARTLYLKFDFNQKQIAEKVGVSEQTICKWAKTEQWDQMRESALTSHTNRLQELYDQLAYVNKRNKEAIEDDDPTTNPNYDDLAKISKAIERLEKDAGIGDIIKAIIDLISFVEKEDISAAKVVSHWGYTFIQDKMNELK